MIHIFFVGGMFGSTVEYTLKSFTKEHTPIKIDNAIYRDGSMHTFEKEFHVYADITQNEIVDFFMDSKPDAITTIVYPSRRWKLQEIYNYLVPYFTSADRIILIYAPSIRSAELNMLMQYHKIAKGKWKKGMDIFFSDQNVSKWNPNYVEWKQMQTWELREWFSLYYPTWVNEWIDSPNQIHNALCIPNTDILFDTKNTLSKIIEYCQLTNDKCIDEFCLEWGNAQNYIVNEFDLLDTVVKNTTENNYTSWDENQLCIISEAIVQNRLRTMGYEIRCHGLDRFPTDSITLFSLLEKI